MTRQQLLLLAIQQGLQRYDDQTVGTALRRLNRSGLLASTYGHPGGTLYQLTPQGRQVLEDLRQLVT